MPFSFGGSRSRSEGRSSSFDMSRSASVSGGESRAGSRASERIAFEDVFARLFGRAEGAATGLDPSLLTTAANQLFSGGVEFLDSLSGGPGADFLASRVAGESPVLDDQIAALAEDVGEFFSEQVNPAITSEFVASGTLGGGRQGVAQGIAAREAGRTFARGATELRAQDMAARDQAAAILGQQRLQGAQTGLAALPSLAGIAEFGFGAELAPYERLAAILGGPVTLSDSRSFSTSEDFARALSSSYGRSESQTSSRSGGLRLGFS